MRSSPRRLPDALKRLKCQRMRKITDGKGKRKRRSSSAWRKKTRRNRRRNEKIKRRSISWKATKRKIRCKKRIRARTLQMGGVTSPSP